MEMTRRAARLGSALFTLAACSSLPDGVPDVDSGALAPGRRHRAGRPRFGALALTGPGATAVRRASPLSDESEPERRTQIGCRPRVAQRPHSRVLVQPPGQAVVIAGPTDDDV